MDVMEEEGDEQGVCHCTPMRVVRWESGSTVSSGDGFSAAAGNSHVLQARKARRNTLLCVDKLSFSDVMVKYEVKGKGTPGDVTRIRINLGSLRQAR
jgi:hypothetical protein